jgi:subtilisin family serine protease
VSSRGPTRDGRRGVTIVAPGEEVIAPLSGAAQDPPDRDRFVVMKGTSMSAAMVTGAVALMFQVDPTRTASQIRKRLEGTARHEDPEKIPSNEWGAGKLDAHAACQP